MSEMIHIASGFQYSVNLRYDLNREDKIENFIPTSAALDFMEDIMKSTREFYRTGESLSRGLW